MGVDQIIHSIPFRSKPEAEIEAEAKSLTEEKSGVESRAARWALVVARAAAADATRQEQAKKDPSGRTRAREMRPARKGRLAIEGAHLLQHLARPFGPFDWSLRHTRTKGKIFPPSGAGGLADRSPSFLAADANRPLEVAGERARPHQLGPNGVRLQSGSSLSPLLPSQNLARTKLNQTKPSQPLALGAKWQKQRPSRKLARSLADLICSPFIVH